LPNYHVTSFAVRIAYPSVLAGFSETRSGFGHVFLLRGCLWEEFRGSECMMVLLEFTEADSCRRQGKRIDEGQGGRIVLVVLFVLEGRIDGRVSGDVFPLLLSRRYTGEWEYA